MRKVKRSTTDERMADMPPFAPDDRVSIRLKSGDEIRHEPVVRPKGHWQKPLTEAELREKFLDCTERRLGRKQAEALFEKLNNLGEVASLRELPVVALA
jgi:2-methylcitrate dehydratase PrpD